jgi:hypothetical protein
MALAFRYRRYGPQRERFEWMEEEEAEDIEKDDSDEPPYWKEESNDDTPRYRYHFKPRK